MGSLFDSILQSDAQWAFADPDTFAEPIIYTPYGSAPIALNAVVNRMSPTPIGEVPPLGNRQVQSPIFEIFIPFDPNNVVGVSSVDRGGDVLAFPNLTNGIASEHRIAEIVTQDAGGWMLRLR